MQLSVRKKCVFALLMIVMLLTISEALFALLLYQKHHRVLGGFLESDNTFLWRLKPMKVPPLQTNSLGFRDFPYHAKAELRVLLLGDSVSYGDGIWQTKDVYPQRLEKKLTKTFHPKIVEVINASVPGYTTLQQLKYLQRRGLAFQPDLVVLQFCLNDIVESTRVRAEFAALQKGRQPVHARLGQKTFFWFFMHSYTVAGVTHLLQKHKRRVQENKVRLLASEKGQHFGKEWKNTIDDLKAFATLTRRSRLPWVVFLPPYRFQLKEPLHTSRPQKRLLRFFREHHIPVIDGLDFFVKQQKAHKTPLFRDANHFSHLGHRKAAALLHAPLVGFLKRKRSP